MSSLTGKQAAFVDEYLLCNFNGAEAARRAGYAKDSTGEATRLLANASIHAALKARLAHRSMTADEVLVRLTEQGRGTLDDVITFHTVRAASVVTKPLAEIIDELRATMAFEVAYAERAGLEGAELEAHTSQLAHLRRRELRLTMRLERDAAAVDEVSGPMVETQVPTVDLAKAAARGTLHLIKSYNAKDDKVELYDAHAALVDIGKHHGMFKDVIEIEIPWDDLTPAQLQRIRDGEDPKKVLRER